MIIIIRFLFIQKQHIGIFYLWKKITTILTRKVLQWKAFSWTIFCKTKDYSKSPNLSLINTSTYISWCTSALTSKIQEMKSFNMFSSRCSILWQWSGEKSERWQAPNSYWLPMAVRCPFLCRSLKNVSSKYHHPQRPTTAHVLLKNIFSSEIPGILVSSNFTCCISLPLPCVTGCCTPFI